MRESERVELVFQAGKPKYDPELGRMSNAEPTKKVLPCFISELGLELKVKLLEKVDVDAKILRFNHVVNGPISLLSLTSDIRLSAERIQNDALQSCMWPR